MSPILGIYASQISGHLWEPAGGYDSLWSTTLSASASSITISNIPQTYKHLQLRMLGRGTTVTGGTYATGIRGQFNSDTASNYSAHYTDGSGTSATAGAVTTSTFLYFGNTTDSNATANIFGATVTDILDYTNTNKYKTIRYLFGADGNGAGYVEFGSGLWQSTSAITNIYMYLTGGSFAQYSSIALYGIK